MSQNHLTTSLYSDVFTTSEKQRALAQIALQRGVIETEDYYDLTLYAPPCSEVVELEFAVITGQQDALVFLRRALDVTIERARANKQGVFAS